MKHNIIIKAAGDWELDVLAVPFGSESDLDADGQYFDQRTNIHQDKLPTVPAVYYHGYGDDGAPMGKPEYVGKAEYHHTDEAGHWYRVILDKTNSFAQKVWDAAKQSLARASSGSIGHLIRTVGNFISEWPLAELSVFDTDNGKQPANRYAVAVPVMKSVYQQAGLTMPDFEPDAQTAEAAQPADRDAESEGKNITPKRAKETIKMSKELTERDIERAAQDAVEAYKAEQEAAAKAEADKQAEIKAAVEAREAELAAEHEAKLEEARKEAAKSRRLPGGNDEPPKNVSQTKYAELRKYDNLTPDDMAVFVGVLDAKDGHTAQQHRRASGAAYKALAFKVEETKDPKFSQAQNAMKAENIKADEIQQQDLASYGDEWVGVAYSNALWESIRAGTFVAEKLPKIEVPAGHESVVIPLESGDPTFYKVAEATDTAASGWPNATITSSQMGTAQKSLSLSKMGARVLWSGELNEDSLIPFVSQLRMQLQKAGAEQLEHAIIDGDTATSASTNINDIAATGAAAGTELFLMFNGFRKSPLVTTTANSRDGGTLTAEDFLETVKLMGAAGLNADVAKTAFIVDYNTYWKALELEEVKSRDVFVSPTIESGALTGIYGYELYRSFQMHRLSAGRKANSAGKVDQDTTSNNSKGAILAVRWDQWMLGYRRRMTMETTRIARADTTEIVALARLGLAQRDTEAAAISYNLTV